MRVALDYDPALRGQAGIARYVRWLTEYLLQSDETIELFLVGSRLEGMPRHPRITPVVHHLPPKLWRLLLLLAHAVNLPLDHWLPPVDLYHATDFAFPPTSASRRQVVVTIHDLAAVEAPAVVTLLNRTALRLFFRVLQSCRYPVIVPSAAVADKLVRQLSYPREQVHVVPLGVGQVQTTSETSQAGATSNRMSSIQQ